MQQTRAELISGSLNPFSGCLIGELPNCTRMFHLNLALVEAVPSKYSL